jgi:predicted DNA binding CopG/RHH family protein
MRARTIKQQFYLNSEEKKLLKEKSKKAGLNESEFIRSMIKGYKIKEQPTKEIREFTRDISGIANNINQIAKSVNMRYGRNEDIEYIKSAVSKFFLDFQKKVYSRN